jgi:hypothetical protein
VQNLLAVDVLRKGGVGQVEKKRLAERKSSNHQRSGSIKSPGSVQHSYDQQQ